MDNISNNDNLQARVDNIDQTLASKIRFYFNDYRHSNEGAFWSESTWDEVAAKLNYCQVSIDALNLDEGPRLFYEVMSEYSAIDREKAIARKEADAERQAALKAAHDRFHEVRRQALLNFDFEVYTAEEMKRRWETVDYIAQYSGKDRELTMTRLYPMPQWEITNPYETTPNTNF